MTTGTRTRAATPRSAGGARRAFGPLGTTAEATTDAPDWEAAFGQHCVAAEDYAWEGRLVRAAQELEAALRLLHRHLPGAEG